MYMQFRNAYVVYILSIVIMSFKQQAEHVELISLELSHLIGTLL